MKREPGESPGQSRCCEETRVVPQVEHLRATLATDFFGKAVADFQVRRPAVARFIHTLRPRGIGQDGYYDS